MHLSLRSYHGQKAVANLSSAMVCIPLTQLDSKLSWDSKRPSSSDFNLGKRKKDTGAISSE
jgi:hypothetical protein